LIKREEKIKFAQVIAFQAPLQIVKLCAQAIASLFISYLVKIN
jgi:hypothetical protein